MTRIARWLARGAAAALLGPLAGSPAHATEPAPAKPAPDAAFTDFLPRGGLGNSYRVFARKSDARVAFMGGSVTTREWREGVQDYLTRRFPDTTFDFVMAGLGGTPAQLGVFRLENDVFAKGPVDLLFLEFAVNGGDVREMEGIVRHARRLNPNLDIVFLYFARTDHVAEDDAGRTPAIVVEHEKVAEHYRLPALFLYRTVARRIREGKMTWTDFSPDNVHPTRAGCDLYAACIRSFLDSAWRTPPAARAGTARLPPPLDPRCFDRGRYIAPAAARDVKGFVRIERWTPAQKTCNFSPPADVFAAETPGAELTLDFTGTVFGFLPIVGEDAGMIEYSLDGAPFVRRDLYSAAYGEQFQLPSPQLIFTDLPDGKHTVVLRVSGEKHPKSKGHAVRILQFLAH